MREPITDEQLAARTNLDCIKIALRFAALSSSLLLVANVLQSRINEFTQGVLAFIIYFVIGASCFFIFQLIQREVVKRRITNQ